MLNLDRSIKRHPVSRMWRENSDVGLDARSAVSVLMDNAGWKYN